MTLDQMVRQMHINTIDFIKLDVDGHEYSVLMGGKETLKTFAPKILMEFAPYLFDDEEFKKILIFLKELDYSLFDANTGSELPLNSDYLRKIIPTGGSRNILLKPN